MASIINATTSTGLVSSADNSGSLQLATNNGTTAVTIDTSQNVGVGTTSPATKFHVSGQTRIADSSNSANYMTLGVGANAPYGNASLSTTTAGLSIVAEGAGNMTFSNNGSERMRINSAGQLLVGTTTGTTLSSVVWNTTLSSSSGNNFAVINTDTSGATTAAMQSSNWTGGGANIINFYNGSGNVAGTISVPTNSSTTTTVSYNTSSDYRMKENIAPMTGALSKITQLKPVTYTWKANGYSGQGFVAHELAEIVPECVTGEKDAVDAEGNPKYQGIDTSFLVATLTAAIQELKAELDATKAEVQALKGVA